MEAGSNQAGTGADYRYFVSRIVPLVPGLTRTVKSRVGDADAASDIVQDALLSAWRERSSFAGVRNPGAWMTRIAQRRVADYYRNKERRPEVPIDPTEFFEHIADDRTYDLFETPLPQLEYGLNRLKYSERALLFFFYEWGYSIKLLAEIYQCSQGLIRTRLSLARSNLKRFCVMQREFQDRELGSDGSYTKRKAVPQIGQGVRSVGSIAARVRGFTYDANRELELYLPQSPARAPWPTVVFAMGIPDEVSKAWIGVTLNNLESFISWGEALAYAGIASITYQTAEPVRDIEKVLLFLHRNGDSIGVDTNRIGLWACSGNAATALDEVEKHCLRRMPPLSFLMLYYPVLTAVEAVRPVSPEQHGVPVMVVRAGSDHPAIDRRVGEFIDQFRAAGGQIEEINYGTGIHAFDAFDVGEECTKVIRRSIDYMKRRFGLETNRG